MKPAIAIIAALLALGASPAASDRFDFADRAHLGHFINIRYQSTGTRIAYGDETDMIAQDDFVAYGDIDIHVSPDGEHFLFFGECTPGGFDAMVRDGNGVRLGGEPRIFDVDCLPDAVAENGDEARWARGMVSFDADTVTLSLAATWMRHEDTTDADGTRRVNHGKHDLSFSLEFENGTVGERDCRIVDLTVAEATQTQTAAGADDILHDNSFSVRYLSRQVECEERPSPFPAPPGTGKPIPPTPHGTP